MMISDLALLKELPESIRSSVEAYVGCISGAMLRDDYLEAIRKAGLKGVEVVEQTSFPVDLLVNDEMARALMKDTQLTPKRLLELAGSVVSLKVEATKPKKRTVSVARK